MPENLRRAAVRGVFWSGVQQASDRGLRLLVISILAAFVAPEVFGVVALAMAVIDGVGVVLNHGLTGALIQREDLTQSHRSSAFVAQVCMAPLLIAVLYLGAGPISSWFGNPPLEGVLRWLSLGLVFTALGAVQEACLRRDLRYKALAIRTLLSRCAGASVGVALAVGGYGAWSLVFMYLTNQGVGVLLLWLVSSWRPSLKFSSTSYRELLRFGLPMVGGESMTVTRNRGADLLVGALLGETALGFFFFAKTLVGGAFALVDGAIAPVAWATMSRLQDSREKLGKALEESAQLTATIVLPAGVGLILVAPLLVQLLYRDRWAPALPIVYSLVACRLLLAFTGHNRAALSAIGKVNANLMLSGAATILTMAGIAFGSHWGLGGVAAALVIATAVQTPVDLVWSLRFLPLKAGSFLLRLAPTALLTLAMLVILLLVRPVLGEGWLALAVLVSSGVVIFGLGSMVAAPQLMECIQANFRRVSS